MNEDIAEIVAVAVANAMAALRDDERLWSARTIGDYMEVSERQVVNRYAPHPDFPKAIRVPLIGGGRGQPRWKAGEVKAWWERYKQTEG